jgi:hypothetical protein
MTGKGRARCETERGSDYLLSPLRVGAGLLGQAVEKDGAHFGGGERSDDLEAPMMCVPLVAQGRPWVRLGCTAF